MARIGFLLLMSVLLLVSGCVERSVTVYPWGLEGPALGPQWNLTMTSPSGFYALSLSHEASIDFEVSVTIDPDPSNYRPLYAAFVHENGTLLPLAAGSDIDDSRLGEGDGVVFAGADGVWAESPNVTRDAHQELQLTFRHRTGAVRGTFLLAWANHDAGIRLEIGLAEGTVVVDEHEGAWQAFELKNVPQGVRVGSPAVRAGVLNRVSLPEEWVFGYVVYALDAGSQGELRIEGPSTSRRLALSPSLTGSGCPCASSGRVVFSGEGPISVDFTLLGAGTGTEIFVAYGAVPPGMLPRLLAESAQ